MTKFLLHIAYFMILHQRVKYFVSDEYRYIMGLIVSEDFTLIHSVFHIGLQSLDDTLLLYIRKKHYFFMLC